MCSSSVEGSPGAGCAQCKEQRSTEAGSRGSGTVCHILHGSVYSSYSISWIGVISQMSEGISFKNKISNQENTQLPNCICFFFPHSASKNSTWETETFPCSLCTNVKIKQAENI